MGISLAITWQELCFHFLIKDSVDKVMLNTALGTWTKAVLGQVLQKILKSLWAKHFPFLSFC